MKILNKFVLLILMSLLISCSGEKKVSPKKAVFEGKTIYRSLIMGVFFNHFNSGSLICSDLHRFD